MNPSFQPQLNDGEADGMVLALELVISTTVLAGLGWLLDGVLGTRPVFTVGLGAFTLAYEVWKLVTGYHTTMAEHDGRRTPLRQGPVK